MDCSYIPKIGMTEFANKLHDNVNGTRTPFSGTIELTARCNLSCLHCYIRRPVYDHMALQNELSTDQVFRLIDEIVEEECLWLLFTGGEPLIRPDFKQIYQYARSKGLIITLFTNGTLIDRYTADFLRDWGAFSVEITLYGHTQRTYETVTGVPGSYDRCMRAIDLLLERGLPLALKSTITSQNKDELWDMKSYAESIGLIFRFDATLIPRLDGNQAVERVRLTPEEVVALDRADNERFKEWFDFIDKFPLTVPNSNKLYKCGAGQFSFYVSSEGCLTPCLMTRRHSYDMHKGSFADGWHNYLAKKISLKADNTTSCNMCRLIALCDNCLGWAHLAGHQDCQPTDYLCQIAQLRAELVSVGSKTTIHRGRRKDDKAGHEKTLYQAGNNSG